MPRRIHLEPHVTEVELGGRYRGARDPVERSRWYFLWLLALGPTATAVAAFTGYSANWIGQIARRHNQDGIESVRDGRRATPRPRTVLSSAQQGDLCAALAGPAPDGDRWCGRIVAAWIGARQGRILCRQTGWKYLRRLGARWRTPRPRHVRADPVAQATWN
jgi:transposase